MDNPHNVVMILGVEWHIVYRKKSEDAYLKVADGYCDNTIKTVVIRKQHENPHPSECADLRAYERQCLRHELVHAFLYESGLAHNSGSVDAWAMNEEMVDWIAAQGPKLFNAYMALGLM